MHRKNLSPKFRILVPAFVEGGMLIIINKTELSSFKTLDRVGSRFFKVIILGRASQSFACSAGMQNYIATLRYNITNITIYAYYSLRLL